MLKRIGATILSIWIGAGGASLAILVAATLTMPSIGFWHDLTTGMFIVAVAVAVVFAGAGVASLFGGLHYARLAFRLGNKG